MSKGGSGDNEGGMGGFGDEYGFGSSKPKVNPYVAPKLAPGALEFSGYGYGVPQLQMVPAPSQLPPMALDPNAILDPTVLAALEIINRPAMMAQVPALMGSGTEYQQAYGLLPQKEATPAPSTAEEKKTNPFRDIMRFGSNASYAPFGSGLFGSSVFDYGSGR